MPAHAEPTGGGPGAAPARGTGGLSVVVITRDEALRIERCLRSVAFADEIVVLDSGSRDDTVARARALGARVETRADWPGFGRQKNRAVELARGPWVLSIDADEEVDPALAASIRASVASPAFDAYWIERASCFGGRRLRFGDWRGDRVLRLFRKDRARFTDDPIHERVDAPPPHGQLCGTLIHYTLDRFEQALEKARRYAAAGAPRVAARGGGGLVPAALHAAWTFARGWLLRGGLLDGWRGLQLAAANAYGTWLRYRLAGRLRVDRRRGGRPPGG